MGLLNDIFRPKKNKQQYAALREAEGYFTLLNAYRPVYTNWQGCLYESEVVRAAVDTKARYISKSKVVIDGAAKPSLIAKLKRRPNGFQTWSQFLYRVSTIVDMCNTAFIVPVLDDSLSVTGYYPVLPERCDILEYKGEPWLKYVFSNGEVGAVRFKECGIITRYQYKNDLFGEKNLPALDSTIDLLYSAKQSIKNATDAANDYKFMAQLDNYVLSEDLPKERHRFSEKNLKADENNKGMLLFPVQYKNIKQLTPSEFTVSKEQMDLIQNNVYSYFGVNKEVIQSRVESKYIDSFYEGTVEPMLAQLTQVMTNVIFTQKEQANGAAISFERQLSNKDRVSMAQQLGDRGMITINEARSLFGYPPIEGGDILPVRGEYYMLGGAGNIENQKASETAEGTLTSEDFTQVSDIGNGGIENEQADNGE